MFEAKFLGSAIASESSIWDICSVNDLASMHVPDSLLGRRADIFKGDINRQWAYWFAEAILDPRCIAYNDFKYPFIFSKVRDNLFERYGQIKTSGEINELASILAKGLNNIAQRHKKKVARSSIGFDDKSNLLSFSGSPPRCWICGAVFTQSAIDSFLHGSSFKPGVPHFIDILKPRGLSGRDFAIEVDHVFPYSQGGGDMDNLRLACGWCNKHKGAHISLYDLEGRPRSARRNHYKLSSLPQPFWVIRMLALGGRCEHPAGCDATTMTSELTVTPMNAEGAINPSNLRVTCYEHDSLVSIRLQSPENVKALWNTI